jgi:hypothetical protein
MLPKSALACSQHKSDDLGWGIPIDLGLPLNSNVNDACLAFFDDDAAGLTVAYFQSSRTTGVSGKRDIYATRLSDGGPFSPPVLVQELSTFYNDRAPSVRRDGLEIYFDSNRPGGVGSNAIWVSTRRSTADPWSPPAPVNSINRRAIRAARRFRLTPLHCTSSLRCPGQPTTICT